MAGVRRLKVDSRRTGILSENEQADILAAAPKKLRALVRLALLTGVRAGELLNLRWDALLKESGGRREARTRDLRVANAALSQLS